MDEFIGIIKLFGGNFAPVGWNLCKGQIIPISQYSALFSIIGPYYGGDGTTTFALPNIPDLAPQGGEPIHYIICMEGIFPGRP